MGWNKPPSSKALKFRSWFYFYFSPSIQTFSGIPRSPRMHEALGQLFLIDENGGWTPLVLLKLMLIKTRAESQILEKTLRTPNQGRLTSQNLRCSYFSITWSHATPSWKYFKIIQHLATLRLKLATGPCPTIPFMFGAGLSGEGRGLRSGSVMNWLVCNGFRNHMIDNDNYWITMLFCKHHITSFCCLYSYDTYLAIILYVQYRIHERYHYDILSQSHDIEGCWSLFGEWWTEYPPGFVFKEKHSTCGR